MKNYVISRTNVKALLVQNGITRQELCLKLGITYQSLTTKLNGRGLFNENEISVLYALLGGGVFLFDLPFRLEKGGKYEKGRER